MRLACVAVLASMVLATGCLTQWSGAVTTSAGGYYNPSPPRYYVPPPPPPSGRYEKQFVCDDVRYTRRGYAFCRRGHYERVWVTYPRPYG